MADWGRVMPKLLDYNRRAEMLENSANDCRFCGHDFLFFSDGAVNCDACQAQGPFAGRQFAADEATYWKAIHLWNSQGELPDV